MFRNAGLGLWDLAALLVHWPAAGIYWIHSGKLGLHLATPLNPLLPFQDAVHKSMAFVQARKMRRVQVNIWSLIQLK